MSLKLKEAGYNIQDVLLFSTLRTVLVVAIPFLLSYLNIKYTSKTLLLCTYLATIIAFGIIYFFTKSFLIVIAITLIHILAYVSRTPLMALLHQLIEDNHFAKAQTIFGSVSWIAAIFG